MSSFRLTLIVFICYFKHFVAWFYYTALYNRHTQRKRSLYISIFFFHSVRLFIFAFTWTREPLSFSLSLLLFTRSVRVVRAFLLVFPHSKFYNPIKCLNLKSSFTFNSHWMCGGLKIKYQIKYIATNSTTAKEKEVTNKNWIRSTTARERKWWKNSWYDDDIMCEFIKRVHAV